MTCSLHLWIWDVLRISFASIGVLMITIVVDWALSTEFYQNTMYFASYNHTLKMFGEFFHKKNMNCRRKFIVPYHKGNH